MKNLGLDHRVVWLAFGALVAAFAACGGAGDVTPIGPNVDGDAASAPLPDAGQETDAGDGVDASSASDASPTADATADADAVPDAATDSDVADAAVDAARGPAVSTGYVYGQDGQLLGEYDEDGNTLQEFVYLGTRLIGVVRDGKAHAIQTDQIGAPRAALSNGTTEWKWDPEPFGATPPDEDPDGDGKKFVLNERFPGQRLDPVSGLYQNFHRNYAPEWARYVEADPIGLRGGMNLYGYVRASPLALVDPYGLDVVSFASAKNNAQYAGALAALQTREPTALIILMGGDPETGQGVNETRNSPNGSRDKKVLGGRVNGDQQAVDPEQLAEYLKKAQLWSGQKIILIQCHSGQALGPGGIPFAQRLADALGADDVLAPNQAVKLTGEGAYKVGVPVPFSDRLVEGPQYKMVPFKAGR